MEIVKNLVPQSKWTLKCPYTMTPEAITVHNTANDASAANEIAYMVRNDSSTSFHYAVDDIQAVQGVEENRNAWHAGDGGDGFGNRKTIGIEICYSLNGGERFIKAEQNAAELIAGILKRYGWGIDKVGTHQMRSGKYCPHRTLDLGWERFLNLIRSKLGPVWVHMDVPRAMRLNKEAPLLEVSTGKVIKTFAKGSEHFFLTKTTFNNELYLRTEWSSTRNIGNGFKFTDLEEIPVVVPETPVVEAPEPIVEPEPIPVEEPTVEPIDTPEDVVVPEVKPQPKSWLSVLLEAIVKIIKLLFGKE